MSSTQTHPERSTRPMNGKGEMKLAEVQLNA
jgi:hypothetical protein